MALVGKQRFENVHTNTPPGRSTRATVVEHVERLREVVDRHAAGRCVERFVGEGQRRVRVEVVDDPLVGLRVVLQLGCVHAQHDEARRRCVEVRHPRRTQVEDVAGEAELVVEVTDRGDRAVVDVLHEPQRLVEPRVGTLVGPGEEAFGELLAVADALGVVVVMLATMLGFRSMSGFRRAVVVLTGNV